MHHCWGEISHWLMEARINLSASSVLKNKRKIHCHNDLGRQLVSQLVFVYTSIVSDFFFFQPAKPIYQNFLQNRCWTVWALLCSVPGAARASGDNAQGPLMSQQLLVRVLSLPERKTHRLSPKTEDEVVLKQQMNNIVRSRLMKESIYTPMQGVQVIANRTRNVPG